MGNADCTVRFRVDFGPSCSIGIGKIELLEGIAHGGSLSQAARTLQMSYRRAWLLLDDMNHCFAEPVALTSTGGRGGGGVVLTAFGKRLVAGYRQMECELKPLAAAHFNDFRHSAKTIRTSELAADRAERMTITSIRRKPARRKTHAR